MMLTELYAIGLWVKNTAYPRDFILRIIQSERDYQIGDKVRVVSERSRGIGVLWADDMDKWLDCVMTISEKFPPNNFGEISYGLVEDFNNRYWISAMFVGLEPEEEFEIATSDELTDLFKGGLV